MAKKQQPQILSPENYIRQKARNLPIFKCLVNEGWEEDKLAQLTIARRHINGNITFCSYLVDLNCLGVKDTFYYFNLPEEDFEEVMEKMEQGYALAEIDYALAHNIIHAGWEYGEEIGFKPHKDFLSITQYMLEEESDAIPLIHIDCGDIDGKPLFVQGPLESDATANRIIAQLEKNVGHGNYRFIMQDEIWDEDDEDDEDEDWDDEDGMRYFREYAQYSHEEKVELFLELSRDMEEADELPEQEDEEDDDDDDGDEEKDEIFVRLTALADHLYHDIVPQKELEQWYDKWNDESLLYTIDEDFAPSEESLNRIEEMMSRVSEHRLSEDELSYKSIFGKRDEITLYEYAQLQTLRLGYFVHEKHLAGLESLYFSIDDEFDIEEDMDEQIDMLLSAALASRIAVLRLHLLSQKEQ